MLFWTLASHLWNNQLRVLSLYHNVIAVDDDVVVIWEMMQMGNQA